LEKVCDGQDTCARVRFREASGWVARSRSKLVAVSIACQLVASFGWASNDLDAPVASNAEDEPSTHAYSAHDYLLRLRAGVWLMLVDGGYQTETSAGNNVAIRVDGDLGYDDNYPTFNGEVSLRWGRHDFWVNGIVVEESEDNRVRVEFEIGDELFDIGVVVDSDIEIYDVNFRYGYSFFEFEDDGFRLGPTIAVSYTKLSAKITEISIAGVPTGTRARYEETLPIPTLGIHAEVPYEDFVLSTEVGGFYADTSTFEATGVRAEAWLAWRPFRHVGFFAGLNVIFADLELSNEEIDDLVLWGPLFGVELRY
jgi:hypothetical protein